MRSANNMVKSKIWLFLFKEYFWWLFYLAHLIFGKVGGNCILCCMLQYNKNKVLKCSKNPQKQLKKLRLNLIKKS